MNKQITVVLRLVNVRGLAEKTYQVEKLTNAVTVYATFKRQGKLGSQELQIGDTCCTEAAVSLANNPAYQLTILPSK